MSLRHDLKTYHARIHEWTALGISADAISASDMRRIRVISLTTAAMCIAGTPSIIQFIRLSMPGTALAVLAAVIAGLVNLVMLRAWPRPNVAGHVAMLVYAAIMGTTVASVGGYYSSNIGWFYTIPLCAAIIVGLRGSLFWTAATALMLVSFWMLPSLGVDLPNHIPPEDRHGNALFTRLLALTAVSMLGASFVAGQRRAERELAQTSEERRREKAYVELIMHAAVSANEASSFEDALQESLERIVNVMGWIGGHACIVRDDGKLVSSGIYHADEPKRFQALLDVTLKREWEPGEGICGRAVLNRRPEFVGEIEVNHPNGRAALANSLGFSSAFAVPIFVGSEIPVVLEFVSADPMPDTEDLLRVFTHIGVQLGRVAEREAMQDRLRQAQKLEAVGQLAAGIAHEINNPMAYVRSNLHTLRSEWDGIAAKIRDGENKAPASHRIDECQELIEESLEGVERTIAIVRDLREFSHSGGARASQRERVDLSEIVSRALRITSARVPGGITFSDEFESGLWTVCAAGQLQQVFVNLVVNAIHAVGDHGHIRLTSGQLGDEVFVRIDDDGVGMSSSTCERIFDPFFTTKLVNEGTGLGLSVSYEIVRSHQGRIEVTSELGGGASFEVRLPAAPALC